MRVALAIAALIAAPLAAQAQDDAPAPSAPSAPPPTAGLPGMPNTTGTQPSGAPGDTAPAPAPTGEQTAPVPTVPTDPAYGDHRDTRNFPAPRGKDVVIVSYPERSKKNLVVMGGLAAGGLIASAIGLYFHLDANSAVDEVSTNKFTGEPWTPARQDTYDRAHSSAVTAGVFYGIGGGLLLATAVMYIVTEPKPETMVIHPHSDPKPTALVAPTRGGAMVGGAWRF